MLTSLPTNMTISDYCNAMDRNEIIVNRTYQRSDQVWPEVAKSFLIESVLLGFPMPKIYLHSRTDLKTRTTVKEIVDGQQRSRTIHDYFHDKFALNSKLETEEVRGQRYSELDEEWQARFVTYSLSIDLFVAASNNEVREIFTRMNSYTVPLKPEEKRHAEYQGAFKWFIYELSRGFSPFLRDVGVFLEKSLVRMQDMKLFTEICHAIDNGVTTTNSVALNALYKKYDKDDGGVRVIEERLKPALDSIINFQFLASSQLSRAHIFYSLVLALINGENPIPGFERQTLIDLRNADEAEARLAELSEALNLEGPELNASPWKEFVEASASRTNVKDQREKRIRAFERALSV